MRTFKLPDSYHIPTVVAMSQKISISISDELDAALGWAAQSRRESKSSVIETFLRENKEVTGYIERIRKQPKTSLYVAHSQFLRNKDQIKTKELKATSSA